MGRKLIDRTGKNYGYLTVLEQVGYNKYNLPLWKCRCKCGNIIVATGSLLGSGRKKSCGCLKKLPKGMAVFHHKLLKMKASAKKRNIRWALSDEEVYKLMQQNCYYCGAKPKISNTKRYLTNRFNGDFSSNGLDRVDNNRGYTLDNVVPCCSECNYAKGTLSATEFKELAARIYKHSVESLK